MNTLPCTVPVAIKAVLFAIAARSEQRETSPLGWKFGKTSYEAHYVKVDVDERLEILLNQIQDHSGVPFLYRQAFMAEISDPGNTRHDLAKQYTEAVAALSRIAKNHGIRGFKVVI